MSNALVCTKGFDWSIATQKAKSDCLTFDQSYGDNILSMFKFFLVISSKNYCIAKYDMGI